MKDEGWGLRGKQWEVSVKSWGLRGKLVFMVKFCVTGFFFSLQSINFYFLDLQPTEAYGLYYVIYTVLFIQYYSVICRPSDPTGEAPGQDSNPGQAI